MMASSRAAVCTPVSSDRVQDGDGGARILVQFLQLLIRNFRS